MRLFIGIELAQAVREAITRCLDELRPLSPDSKWISPEKAHLTLAFLGHQEEALRPGLEAALAEAAAPSAPFELSFAGGGGFGGRSRPRVLFVDVGGALAELAGLQGAVAAAVQALGIALEERPYRAHLTLARARHPRGDPGLATCVERLQGRVLAAQRVTEAVLFQSHTSPTGARYEALFRAPLT